MESLDLKRLGCSLVSVLAYGLYLEPVIHPKPGAVTMFRAHSDKSVNEFILNASIAEVALRESCLWGSEGLRSPIARGLRVYRLLVVRAGLKTNVALGSIMLLLPLAVALSRRAGDPVGLLVREAHSIILRETGVEEAREYYKLLEYFKPSHLGRYEGLIPGVGSGYPTSFVEILRVASWDLIHRELLEGYPITLEAYNLIARSGSLDWDIVLSTLLELLARHGDTLIASKYGFSAYKRAKLEAGEALRIAEREGVLRAIEWLDELWRPRGWNPGAVLDVIATALSLTLYSSLRGDNGKEIGG